MSLVRPKYTSLLLSFEIIILESRSCLPPVSQEHHHQKNHIQKTHHIKYVATCVRDLVRQIRSSSIATLTLAGGCLPIACTPSQPYKLLPKMLSSLPERSSKPPPNSCVTSQEHQHCLDLVWICAVWILDIIHHIKVTS